MRNYIFKFILDVNDEVFLNISVKNFMDTILSPADVALIQEINWNVKELTKSRYPIHELQENILDLTTELLDTETPTHIDKDRLPDPTAIKTVEESALEQREAALPKQKINGKIAIVIGHNKWTGASSHKKDDEWTTRKAVAEKLQDELAAYGIESKIFIRNKSLGYGAAMREHGRNINAYGADAAIELHFNSATASAHGAEFICVSRSGAVLAGSLAKAWKVKYPDITLRRDNGVYKLTSGRGAGFCRAPRCPAIVYEPCFASNPKEWAIFDNEVQKEAEAIALGLFYYLTR